MRGQRRILIVAGTALAIGLTGFSPAGRAEGDRAGRPEDSLAGKVVTVRVKGLFRAGSVVLREVELKQLGGRSFLVGKGQDEPVSAGVEGPRPSGSPVKGRVVWIPLEEVVQLVVTEEPGPTGASTVVVTNLDDSGPGSLRQAILDANGKGGPDVITFAPRLEGMIRLAGALPPLSGEVDIQGPGATALTVRRDAGGDYRIFAVLPGGTVHLSGLTIANGKALHGGGIHNAGTLTITSCTLEGNQGDTGGVHNIGTLTILNSTFSRNLGGVVGGVQNAGGTMRIVGSTFVRNFGVWGGAIHSTSSGPDRPSAATVLDCTIAHNRGSNGGGIMNRFGSTMTIRGCAIHGNEGWNGGGLHNSDGGRLVVINTTISGNTAIQERGGGGIFNWHNIRSTRVLNCTIVNNKGAVGGGILNWSGIDPSAVILRNTIVAGNSDRTGATRDDVRGPLNASSSHNLIGVGSGLSGIHDGVAGNQVGMVGAPIDPRLGPLKDDGGPTWTHALQPESPAVDAGDNTDAPPTDQRGRPRIVNGTIDIGACELQPWGMSVERARVRSGVPASPESRPILVGLGP